MSARTPKMADSRPYTGTASITSSTIFRKYSKYLEPPQISIKPNPVVFTEYEADEEFEQFFEVQNVSLGMILVRITKPKTKYFTISFTEKAETPLAPGMSCKFSVKFKPNHLSDFDDAIEVISNDSKTNLPLLGRRPHSVLTLPRILDCGHCPVDAETTIQYDVVNTGSTGSFRFISEPSTLDTFISTETNIFEHPPFYIEPQEFTLRSNESIRITITYRPLDHASDDTFSLYLQSNDLQIREYQCIGKSFFPRLAVADESHNSSPLVAFSDSNPHTVQKRNIAYCNTSPLPIQFSWLIFDGSESGPVRMGKQRDKFNFQISPSSGVIPVNGVINFEITFEPKEIGQHASFLVLYIENIPLPRTPEHPYYLYKNLDYDSLRQLLHSDEIVTTNDPLNFFTSQTPLKERQENTDVPQIGAIPCSHIRLYGKCTEIDVRMQPPILMFGSPLTIGVQITRIITLYNDGDCKTNFNWINNPESEDYYDVSFTPKSGTIAPHKSTTITLKFTPYFVGDLNENFLCEIEHTKALTLAISAKTKGPVLHIDAPAIDFGIIEAGKERSAPIQITNISDVQLEYQFISPSLPNDQEYVTWNSHNNSYRLPYLIFEPYKDVLAPKESILVNMTVIPPFPMTIDEIIECKVLHGESRYISVRGEVQSTSIKLNTNIIDLGTVYVNCPVTRSFSAKNHSYLTTNFFWFTEDESADNGKGYTLTIDRNSGSFSSSETQNFTITFTPQRVGEYEALLPCFIQEDRDNVVGLIVKARVLGLELSIQVKDANGQLEDDNNEPVIDFGQVPLFEKQTMTVSIVNHSQCVTQYALALEKFGAPIGHSRSNNNILLESMNKSTTVNLLKQTGVKKSSSSQIIKAGHYETLAYQSHHARSKWNEKTNREQDLNFNKEILVEGNGIAFDADSLNGTIDSLSTVDVNITVYSNACGMYQDVVILEIVGYPTITIPVRATVVGCPLVFLPKTLGLKFDRNAVQLCDHVGELTWAAVPVNTDAPNKVIQVKNTSLTDIQVSWKLSSFYPIQVRLTELLKSDTNRSRIQVNFDTRLEKDIIALNDQPFSLEPRTLVIPANDVKSFTFGFKSNQLQIFNELVEATCTCVRGHHAAMYNNHHSLVGDVTEYMRPLKLALTASTIPTRLNMNYKKIKFVCSVGDDSESSCRKSFTLTNNTSTKVSFKLCTEPSDLFILSDQRKIVNVNSATVYTLQSQQDLTMSVNFVIPKNSNNKKLFTGCLKVMYLNNEEQLFDIEAELHSSQLQVTPSILDFGLFARQFYNPQQFLTIPFYIQNMSRVARGKWRIQSVDEGTEEEPVFVLSATEGITPYANNLIEGKSVVYVDFKPKKNSKFEKRFDVVALSSDDKPSDIIGSVLCTGSAKFDEYADTLRAVKKK